MVRGWKGRKKISLRESRKVIGEKDVKNDGRLKVEKTKKINNRLK
jgi:hypothetical protein